MNARSRPTQLLTDFHRVISYLRLVFVPGCQQLTCSLHHCPVMYRYSGLYVMTYGSRRIMHGARSLGLTDRVMFTSAFVTQVTYYGAFDWSNLAAMDPDRAGRAASSLSNARIRIQSSHIERGLSCLHCSRNTAHDHATIRAAAGP